MARTSIKSLQIGDTEVKRADLNTTTSGQAVVAKIVQGTGISLSSTGADSGTGDVTINSTGLLLTGGTLTGEVIVSSATGPTDVASIGFRGSPQNIQNADYTFVLSDAAKTIFHDEVTARTYTIPANSSVVFPIGTIIIVGNNVGAGNITVAITTDTLRRSDGTSTTGSFTIVASSLTTIIKTKATEWFINSTVGSAVASATTSLNNLASVAINAALLLGTSDAAALGSATKQWSDLFLAEGGVINWDNGDISLTQTGNILALAGGDLEVPDEAYDATGWNSDLSVPTKNAVRDKIETIQAGTGLPTVITLAVSDEATALTAGTAKITFRMPFVMTLTAVRASVNTAPTGSILIVDINDGGTTIMTTNKLSIDASEKTSTTAATAAGITDTALADDAEITIDIDQVGSTIAGKGLKVVLIGTRT